MSAACCAGRVPGQAARQFGAAPQPRCCTADVPCLLPCPVPSCHACPAVGPVWVETPDQMLHIYEKMRADGRLRFFF
jgi:hypothetical protein